MLGPKRCGPNDAQRMAVLGLSYVRADAFSWRAVEPEPGRFEWSWLDRAVEVVGCAGLKFVKVVRVESLRLGNRARGCVGQWQIRVRELERADGTGPTRELALDVAVHALNQADVGATVLPAEVRMRTRGRIAFAFNTGSDS